MPKERVEVYCNGVSAVLDDFHILTFYARGKRKEKKLMAQDKGQKAEVGAFLKAILEGKQSPVPFEEIVSASLVTFKILESYRQGCSISI